MAALETVVRGRITRLYPGSDRLYFVAAGDSSPQASTENHYNFILYTAPNFQPSYELLLKAAEHRWVVTVRRSNSMEKHRKANENWMHYHVDYVNVDFKS